MGKLTNMVTEKHHHAVNRTVFLCRWFLFVLITVSLPNIHCYDFKEVGDNVFI